MADNDHLETVTDTNANGRATEKRCFL
jgi:hypothetical protein